MMVSRSFGTGSWREAILRHFPAGLAAEVRVSLVADPDGLLLDDQIAAVLSRDGFDLVAYRDPVEFRFYFESRHRSRWRDGERTSLVISVPAGLEGLGRVPFDLYGPAQSAGRMVEVSLGSVFSGLDPTSLAELDPSDLDFVWASSRGLGKETLGANQTKDLVLRSVFKLSAEMIADETDLLVQLLRLHYGQKSVPRGFAVRFAESLRKDPRFLGWPIAEWTASADEFLRMLQERWGRHLLGIESRLEAVPMSLTGPESVDFGAPELRAIIDNLFLEARLAAVSVPDTEVFAGRFERCGVVGLSGPSSADRAEALLVKIVAAVPEPGVPPTVWQRFGHQWSELARLADSLPLTETQELRTGVADVRRRIDDRLWEWLVDRFGTLVSRNFWPAPCLVHQIPHFLAHKRSPGDRLAVVVIDGMSLAQWSEIRQAQPLGWATGLSIEESAVFAWIPTITPVSRQSIFSGQIPMYFERTILRTDAEERLWKAFWEERGWRRERVGYFNHRDSEPEGELIKRVVQGIEDERLECVGVVVNSIDRLVHGSGPEGNVLAAAVRQWAANGHVSSMVRHLVDRGFDVMLCSDHGNVDAVGIGRSDLGQVPDSHGQRAIIFPDSGTLAAATKELVDVAAWPGHGLPQSVHVLLPRYLGAFMSQGSHVRSHGGASIDEVLVPLVRITRQP